MLIFSYNLCFKVPILLIKKVSLCASVKLERIELKDHHFEAPLISLTNDYHCFLSSQKERQPGFMFSLTEVHTTTYTVFLPETQSRIWYRFSILDIDFQASRGMETHVVIHGDPVSESDPQKLWDNPSS